MGGKPIGERRQLQWLQALRGSQKAQVSEGPFGLFAVFSTEGPSTAVDDVNSSTPSAASSPLWFPLDVRVG
jgi:hypothetical protein